MQEITQGEKMHTRLMFEFILVVCSWSLVVQDRAELPRHRHRQETYQNTIYICVCNYIYIMKIYGIMVF